MSTEQQKPAISFAGIIYGDVIYWGTLLGTFIALAGMSWAFLGGDNVLDVGYVFSAMWQGHGPKEIWEGALGAGNAPNHHWYLSSLSSGDALSMFGMAFAVFSVVPGMLLSAYYLFKEKLPMFAVFALISATIIVLTLLGVLKVT